MIFEPGRGMVADTGVTVASVVARTERKSGTWIFLDVGVFNAFYETMAYQGSIRYKVTSMHSSNGDGTKMFT